MFLLIWFPLTSNMRYYNITVLMGLFSVQNHCHQQQIYIYIYYIYIIYIYNLIIYI